MTTIEVSFSWGLKKYFAWFFFIFFIFYVDLVWSQKCFSSKRRQRILVILLWQSAWIFWSWYNMLDWALWFECLVWLNEIWISGGDLLGLWTFSLHFCPSFRLWGENTSSFIVFGHLKFTSMTWLQSHSPQSIWMWLTWKNMCINLSRFIDLMPWPLLLKLFH